MKKTFILTLIIFISQILCLGACKSATPDYTGNIVELRSNVFYGESEEFKVKAYYGFTKNQIKDYSIYKLTFMLLDKAQDNVSYSILLAHDQKEYRATFSLSPVSGLLTCGIDVQDFNLNEFTISISYSSTTKPITLKTQLDSNCKTYEQALNSLHNSQPQLIKAYSDENGKFTAKVHIRVLVKNSSPYYYVGLENQKSSTKALLIDGVTLEVLAIRDIF